MTSGWRKSSSCQSGECVWVRPCEHREAGGVCVSDRPGDTIRTQHYTRDAWDAFVAGVRNNEFDGPAQ